MANKNEKQTSTLHVVTDSEESRLLAARMLDELKALRKLSSGNQGDPVFGIPADFNRAWGVTVHAA